MEKPVKACPNCGGKNLKYWQAHGDHDGVIDWGDLYSCEDCLAIHSVSGKNWKQIVNDNIDPVIASALTILSRRVHRIADDHGFWSSRDIGKALFKIVMEVAEIGQALEDDCPQDKHLPEFNSLTIEVADTIIRLLDLAGFYRMPIGPALIAKMKFNETRPHRHGKAF